MFSAVLRDLRMKGRLSQSQLAKSIGVSPGNVSDWELDKTKPGYVALSSLARYFDVSADYLLELGTLNQNNHYPDLSSIKNEQGLLCDGSPLTDMEADAVAMYRLLPESHKEEIFDLIYFKYKRHVEEKKESIYSTYAESDPEDGSKTTHGIA